MKLLGAHCAECRSGSLLKAGCDDLNKLASNTTSTVLSLLHVQREEYPVFNGELGWFLCVKGC